MYASSGPALETVKVLLEAGADINQADGVEGFTAAMFAASEGQTQVFKWLLDAGADISLKDIDGESARDFAQTGGHTEIVRLIDGK
jgi:ankyrin repeat protein